MSHFTRMKTRLVVQSYLVSALEDLGYTPQVGHVNIRGYQGIQTEVDVRIPTQDPGYDIGFRKQDDTYELVADWWGIQDIQPEPFLQQVQQRYAYHTVVARMAEQGFDVVQEEQDADRTIRLTVRRAVF